MRIRSLGPLVLMTLVAAGCGRDASEAGSRLVGAGLNPDLIQSPPTEKGGLIDYMRVDYEGRNLTLQAIGFGGSTPYETPVSAVVGYSLLFTPALVAGDEYALLSPKGPDQLGTCIPLVNNSGPLGAFDTVDVGDSLMLTNSPEDPNGPEAVTFALQRDPADYPPVSNAVTIQYPGLTDSIEPGEHDYLTPTWNFGEELNLVFDGGLPPAEAAVASVPRPSDAADQRVGKEAGHPTILTPFELTGVTVATEGGSPQPVEFYNGGDAGEAGPPLPSPLTGVDEPTGGMTIGWNPLTGDELAQSQANGGHIVIQVQLYGSMPTDGVPNPINPSETVACHDDWTVDPADYDTDAEYLAARAQMAQYWCDPGYEPDADRPGRHYRTSECIDGRCYGANGSLDFSAALGELVCSVDDSAGQFAITEEVLDLLVREIDYSQVAGATIGVARVHENEVSLPGVKDPVGNFADINPVRLRATHMVLGRLATADGRVAAGEEE